MSKESGEVIKRRGLVKKHAAVDHEVWQWKMRQELVKGGRVTKAEVQSYALQAYQHAGIANFKASDGWYRRWRIRWQQIAIASDRTSVKDVLEDDGGKCSHPNTKEGNQVIMSIDGVETSTENQTLCQSDDLNEVGDNGAPISVLEVAEKNKVGSKHSINDGHNRGKCHKLPVVNTKNGSIKREHKANSNSNRCDLLINNETVSDCEAAQHSLNSSVSMQIDEEQTDMDIADNQGIQASKNTTDCVVILKDFNAEELPVNNVKSLKNAEDQVKNIRNEAVVSIPNEAIPSSIALPLTPPSSSASFDTYYTSPSLMSYQNDFDFGDELFCDTCEDFHPRHPGALVKCHKRIKRTDSKLLLSGVSKGKESVVEGLQEVLPVPNHSGTSV